MEYKLFTEFITLQSLLKNLGIIHSGGAIKNFLQNETVFLNKEIETRRGKKLRIGDIIFIESKDIEIKIVEPSHQEMEDYKQDQEEKLRVEKIVKELNKANSKTVKKQNSASNPPRFPGI